MEQQLFKAALWSHLVVGYDTYQVQMHRLMKGRKIQRNQEWFYKNRERNKIFNFFL